MTAAVSRSVSDLVAMTKVLVIDDEPYMRKVIRSLLLASGLKQIHEAPNGRQGLDAICGVVPDVVFLDWEMPDMNGTDFMRQVRSPETFAHPNIPVIMLTGHVGRERVLEAIKHGVHEYLCKPVSAKSLLERIVAVRVRPRPMVRIGSYYGPKPRKLVADAASALMPFPDDSGWLTSRT